MLNLFTSSSLLIMSSIMFLSLLSNKLLMFWMSMEISSFFLIYMFLKNKDNSKTSFSSFMFYLSNGMSSMFIIVGCYTKKSMLMFYGLSCKFFMFPFSMLLLYMFEKCKWMLMFSIGSLFKGLVLCLSYLKTNYNSNSLYSSSMMTLFLCCLFLLIYKVNLKGMWFVLNLSSSVMLFMSCKLLSKDLMLWLYLIYLLLSLINIYCLSKVGFMLKNFSFQDKSYTCKFLLSMVAFPMSMNFIYKSLSIMLCLTCCSSVFLISWCMYLCMETAFLLFYFSKILENFSVSY